MDSKILELENLIDSEIEEYKKIEILFIEKKEILSQSRRNELLDIDTRILDVIQSISNIADKRENVSKDLNLGICSITEIVSYLTDKNVDPGIITRFKEKQVQIQEMSHRIATLDKINAELAEHGLEFTTKTLEAILKGFKLSNQEYNEHGRSVPLEPLDISSIIEEA